MIMPRMSGRWQHKERAKHRPDQKSQSGDHDALPQADMSSIVLSASTNPDAFSSNIPPKSLITINWSKILSG
jgi:hypothetical protein